MQEVKGTTYRGICWSKTNQKWVAQYKGQYLGGFDTKHEASHAHEWGRKESQIREIQPYSSIKSPNNYPHIYKDLLKDDWIVWIEGKIVKRDNNDIKLHIWMEKEGKRC